MMTRIGQKRRAIIFSLFLITMLSGFAAHAFSAKDVSVKKNDQVINKTVQEKASVPITFKARHDDDFLLSADYYYTGKALDKEKSSGVIILHDCHSERSRYSELTKTIAAQDLHVLSLDLRGYGDSIAKGFSELEIKKQAHDIESYQNEIALLTSYWAEDLYAAHQFLQSKVNKSKGIAVVASGCSAGYAVSMAEKNQLNAIVFITPEMSYADKERYKNLVDIPTYFITSTHHLDSYNTAQELFAWNGAPSSKIQVFKGSRREIQLIGTKLNLVSDITEWLKFNLR